MAPQATVRRPGAPMPARNPVTLPPTFALGRAGMTLFLVVVMGRELYAMAGSGFTVVGLVALAVLAAAWSWFWVVLAGGPDRPWNGVCLAAVLGAAAALVLWTPSGASPFYYAAIVAGAAYAWRTGVGLVLGVATCATATWVGVAGVSAPALQVTVITLLLGGGALVVRRYVAASLALEAARDEVRRLAARDATTRLARDLHDELGQLLSVLVLQAEMLAADAPPATALATRAELIFRTSRDALASMRSAVSAVRRPTLDGEARVAHDLLEAAGVHCEVALGHPLPPSVDELFGAVVREATTNVLRHSRAGTCWISTHTAGARAVLEVRDDGSGLTGGDGGGITGMRDRVAEAGGRLQVAGRAGEGTLLTVDVAL